MEKQVLFLFVSCFLYGIVCDYQSGSIDVGQKLSDPKYSTKGYDVYQTVYGLSFAGIIPDDRHNPTQLNFLLNHVPCPDGTNCNYGSEQIGLMNIDITLNQITGLTIIPFVDGYISDIAMITPLEIDRNQSAVFLSDQYEFVKVDIEDGIILGTYPAPKIGTDIYFAAMREELLFSYNYNDQELKFISTSNMTKIESLSLQSYNLSALIYYGEVNPIFYSEKTEQLYIAGVTSQSNISVIVVSGANTYDNMTVSSFMINQDTVPVSNAVVSIFEEQFFHGEEGDASQFIVIQNGFNGYSNVTSAVIIKFNGTDSYSQSVVLPNFYWYAGHFFNGDYLYVYTQGGQIYRLVNSDSAPFSLDGVMTTATQYSSQSTYNPGVNPILGPNFVDQTNNIVWLTTQWWGYILKLNLNNFCVDGSDCKVNTSPKVMLPKWAIAVIVIGSMLFLIAIGGAIVAFFRKRRSYHKLDMEDKHHHHHHQQNHEVKYGSLS